jgi:hypothetical protein
MLLLQGGRDYNVVKKDYDLWLVAMSDKPNFKSVFYDDLDHLFFEGKGMAKPEDISKPNHVSQKITEKMAEFVLGK